MVSLLVGDEEREILLGFQITAGVAAMNGEAASPCTWRINFWQWEGGRLRMARALQATITQRLETEERKFEKECFWS